MKVKQHTTKQTRVNEEIKQRKKYLERNENGNTMFKNLWDATKAVLRRKSATFHAYLRKQKILK